jgi:hypothetical protein
MIVYGSESDNLKTTATKLEDFLTEVGIKGFSEAEKLSDNFTELLKQWEKFVMLL